MGEVNESFLQAMKIVAESEIKKVSFDQTIKATILNDEKAEEGRYWCTNGYSEFWAYSAEVKYKAQDKVLVTIPQGDYVNQKVIISKQADETNSPLFYVSPLASMVDLTSNIIPGEHEEDIWANDGYFNQAVDSLYSWDMNTKFFKDSAAFKYGTPFFDSSNGATPLFEKGITRLGLQAQFSTWLSEYATVSGNYGIVLELTFRCLDLPDGTTPTLVKTIPQKRKVYYTKSGNKYNQITTEELNYITNGENIPACIEMSTAINGKQEQTGKFKLSDSSDFIPLYELQTTNEFTKYINFDSDEFFGDVYAYETFYTNETVFDISQFIDYALVRVRAWFYQRDNFKTMLGEYVPAPIAGSYSDINPNIFMKDPLIILGIAAEEFVDDQASIVTESSLSFYKNVDRSLDLIMEEEIKQLQQNYYDGLIATEALLNQRIEELKESYKNMTDEEKELKRKSSNEKIIKLKWVHKDENTKVIRLIEEEKYPEDYEIRWYRWALGASSPDQFAGAHWVRFYGCKDIADSESEFCISQEEYDTFMDASHPQHSWMLNTDPTNELIIHFKPNINRSQEKIKAIILKKEVQTLTTYIIENGEGNEQSREAETDIIYRLAAATNEITFLNNDEVRNQQTYIDINALSVRFDDESNGRYFLYNRAGNVSRTADLEIRTLTAVFDENETDVYLKSEIPPGTKCKWTFPASNTMITPATSADLSGQPTTNIVFTDTPSVGYFIKKSLNRQDNNNTVQLEAIIDGISYTAEAHMFFGTAGTSGSDYTLDLIWKNDIALDVTDPSKGVLIGEVGLFDSAGYQVLGDENTISDVATDYELKYEWEVGQIVLSSEEESSNKYDFAYEENDILYPTFPSNEYATFYNDGTGINDERKYGGYYYFVDSLITIGKTLNEMLIKLDDDEIIEYNSSNKKFVISGEEALVQYNVDNLEWEFNTSFIGNLKTSIEIQESSSTLAYFDLNQEKFVYLKDAFSDNLSADTFQEIANSQLYRKKNGLANLNVIATERNEEFFKIVCDVLWPEQNFYKRVLDLYFREPSEDVLDLQNKRKSAQDIGISDSNLYVHWDKINQTNLDDEHTAQEIVQYDISLANAQRAFQEALDSLYYEKLSDSQTIKLSQVWEDIYNNWQTSIEAITNSETEEEKENKIVNNYFKAQKLLYENIQTMEIMDQERELQSIIDENNSNIIGQPINFYEEYFNNLFLVPNFYELILSNYSRLGLSIPNLISNTIIDIVNNDVHINYARVVYPQNSAEKAQFQYVIQKLASLNGQNNIINYINSSILINENIDDNLDHSLYRCTQQIKDGTSLTETLVPTGNEEDWLFNYDWSKPKFSFKALKNVNGKPEDADEDWISKYGTQTLADQKSTWWRSGRQVVKDNKFYKKLANAITDDTSIVTQTQLDGLMSKVYSLNNDWNFNSLSSSSLEYKDGSNPIKSFSDEFSPMNFSSSIDNLINKLKTLRTNDYLNWKSTVKWYIDDHELTSDNYDQRDDEINKILFTGENLYSDDYLLSIFNTVNQKLIPNNAYDDNRPLNNIYQHKQQNEYTYSTSIKNILTDSSLTSVLSQKKAYQAMKTAWDTPTESNLYYYDSENQPSDYLYQNLAVLSGLSELGYTNDEAKEALTLALTIPSEYQINSSENMLQYVSDFYISDFNVLDNDELNNNINNVLMEIQPFEQKLSNSRIGMLLQDLYNNRTTKIYSQKAQEQTYNLDSINNDIKNILLSELNGDSDPNNTPLRLTLTGQHEYLTNIFGATSSSAIESNLNSINDPSTVRQRYLDNTNTATERIIYRKHNLDLSKLTFASEAVTGIEDACFCFGDVQGAILQAVLNNQNEMVKYFPAVYSAYNNIYSGEKYKVVTSASASLSSFKYKIIWNLLFDFKPPINAATFADDILKAWFCCMTLNRAQETNYTDLSFKLDGKEVYYKRATSGSIPNDGTIETFESQLSSNNYLSALFKDETQWITNYYLFNTRYAEYYLLTYSGSETVEGNTSYNYTVVNKNNVFTTDIFYKPLFVKSTNKNANQIENLLEAYITKLFTPVRINNQNFLLGSLRNNVANNAGNYYNLPFRTDENFGKLSPTQQSYFTNSEWDKIVGHLLFACWDQTITDGTDIIGHNYYYDDISEYFSSQYCFKRNGTEPTYDANYIKILTDKIVNENADIYVGEKLTNTHLEVPIIYHLLMKNDITNISDIIKSAMHSPIIFKELFPLNWSSTFALDSNKQLINKTIDESGAYAAKSKNTWYVRKDNINNYYMDIRDSILQTIYYIKNTPLKNVSDESVAKLEIEENIYNGLSVIYDEIMRDFNNNDNSSIIVLNKTPYNSIANYMEQFYTILFGHDPTKSIIILFEGDSHIFLYNCFNGIEVNINGVNQTIEDPYWYQYLYPKINYQAGLISYSKKSADLTFNAEVRSEKLSVSDDIFLRPRYVQTQDQTVDLEKTYYYFDGVDWKIWRANNVAEFNSNYSYFDLITSTDSKPITNKIYFVEKDGVSNIWITNKVQNSWPSDIVNRREFKLTTDSTPNFGKTYYILEDYSWVWEEYVGVASDSWIPQKGLPEELKITTDTTPVLNKIYFKQNNGQWEIWRTFQSSSWPNGNKPYELIVTEDSSPVANKHYYYLNTYYINYGTWFPSDITVSWSGDKPYELTNNINKYSIRNKLKIDSNSGKLSFASIKNAIVALNDSKAVFYDYNNNELTQQQAFEKLAKLIFINYQNISLSEWLNLIINSINNEDELTLVWTEDPSITDNLTSYYFLQRVDSKKNILYNLIEEWKRCFSSEDNSLIDMGRISRILETLNEGNKLFQIIPLSESNYRSLTWFEQEALLLWNINSYNLPVNVNNKIIDILQTYDKLKQNAISIITTTFNGYTLNTFSGISNTLANYFTGDSLLQQLVNGYNAINNRQNTIYISEDQQTDDITTSFNTEVFNYDNSSNIYNEITETTISIQRKPFIKVNDYYIIDPYGYWRPDEVYYQPDQSKSTIGKLTPLVYSPKGDKKRTIWIYPKTGLTSETLMNSLSVLKVTLTKFGDYDLIAYFPIALKNGTVVRKTDNTILFTPAYIEGATYVRYSTMGETDYEKNPYRAFSRQIVESAEGISVERNSLLYIDDACGWQLLYPNPEQEFSNFIPSLSETKRNIRVAAMKDQLNYKYQLPLLRPITVYIPDAAPYGVKYFYHHVATESEKFTVGTPLQSIPVWTQAIYCYEDNYPSTTLNKWNGKNIATDEETGSIVASAIAAGKKERDNTFTGVMMGDWSRTDTDIAITKQTGLFGFNHGSMAYAFKDDGTGFIGKDGRGRIIFDGNKSTIYSNNWKGRLQSGMYLDIDDGIIKLQSDPLDLIAGTEFIFYHTTQNIPSVDEQGQLPLSDENAWNLRFLLNTTSQNSLNRNEVIQAVKDILTGQRPKEVTFYTAEGTAFAEAYPAAGTKLYVKNTADQQRYITLSSKEYTYPLSIGTDKRPSLRKFRVTWDGVAYIDEGRFSGMIYASGGEINGDMNVNGTLTGGKLIGSYIEGSTIVGSHVEADYLQANVAGEIAGWTITPGALINLDRSTVLYGQIADLTYTTASGEQGSINNPYGVGIVTNRITIDSESLSSSGQWAQKHTADIGYLTGVGSNYYTKETYSTDAIGIYSSNTRLIFHAGASGEDGNIAVRGAAGAFLEGGYSNGSKKATVSAGVTSASTGAGQGNSIVLDSPGLEVTAPAEHQVGIYARFA